MIIVYHKNPGYNGQEKRKEEGATDVLFLCYQSKSEI